MRVYKNLFNKGFTLVELLVVIAIIAILFAVILIAINPAQRFKDSRNSRRLSDVKSIVEAATTYTADRRGTQLPDVPDYQCVGIKNADDFSTIPTGSTAVWRMDEASGLLADSAGATSNNITTANITYDVSGKFNKAVQMNGSTSSLFVSDDAELNPTSSALTLEGWIKLNQKIEPGSFDHHLPIFDKGTYRLRLNSDSGKLEFDIQGNAISWNLTNEYTSAGSDSVKGINTIAQFQDSLYAGALTNNVPSEGRILKQSGGAWSVFNDYANAAGSVNALTVYNGKLYSGHSQKMVTDLAAVYVFDGTNWQNTDLGAQAGVADVLSLIRYKGKLYAGLGGANGSIWEYDGTSWRSSKSFSSNDAIAVYSLAVFQGKLYAGTGGGSGPNPAHIFEFDGNVWGGNSVVDFTKDGVYSLAVYKNGATNNLFIGLGGSGVNDGEIWKWNGSGPPSLTTSTPGFKSKTMAFGVFDGALYAGSSDLSDDSNVVMLNSLGSNWVVAGGNGIPDTNTDEVRFIGNHNGKLYVAGRGNTTSEAGIVTRGTNGFAKSQKSTWYPNVWYHIASVYDGSTPQIKISINGSIDANVASGVPATSFTNTNELRLGSGFSSDPFYGILDNFAVYNNTALSATEIASHAGCYNLGQYLAPEYMGSLPIDPSSEVTDGTDTGYFISKDTGGVITITAPLTETSSSIPEIIKASR